MVIGVQLTTVVVGDVVVGDDGVGAAGAAVAELEGGARGSAGGVVEVVVDELRVVRRSSRRR